MRRSRTNRKRNAPDWTYEKATTRMKREMTNALVMHCIEEKVNLQGNQVPLISLSELLPNLRKQHRRWKDVTEDNINTGEQRGLKTICSHLHNLRRDPADIAELVYQT